MNSRFDDPIVTLVPTSMLVPTDIRRHDIPDWDPDFEPVLVTPALFGPKLYVCDGHHRVAAAQSAREMVMCYVLLRDEHCRFLPEGTPMADNKTVDSLRNFCWKLVGENYDRQPSWRKYRGTHTVRPMLSLSLGLGLSLGYY